MSFLNNKLRDGALVVTFYITHLRLFIQNAYNPNAYKEYYFCENQTK